MSLRAFVRLDHSRPASFLAAIVLAAAAFAAPASAQDFTQGVTSLNATQARPWFAPNGYTAGYVIVHYLVNNVNQQNVNMVFNGGNGRWEYTISGLSSGSAVTYFFTYNKNGTQLDSQWFQYTHGGGSTPTATPGPTSTPPSGSSFEAESGAFSGATRRSSCGACSGGAKVGYIGNSAANFLTMNISVATGGSRSMTIHYLVSGTRTLFYRVNGGTGVSLALSGSSFSVPATRNVTVNLNAGSNSIRFYNNSAYGPDLDRISFGGGTMTPTPTPPGRVTPTASPTPRTRPTPTAPPVGGAHKRLKIISGCSQPMWIQYLGGNGGGTLSAPNRHMLPGTGSFIEYDIPDKGLAGLRVWPGFGCDGAGQNCRIGASGGPATLGFTCPAGIGCAPPVDSKWEGTFGCIPGIPDSQCQNNPSGSGPLGRGDFWNSSFVDGYTVPMRVNVVGHCPPGPQPAPVYGPGGPPGGVIDCSNIRYSDCPRNENLSTDGRFPHLSSMDLLLRHPNPDGSYSSIPVGCFSPSGKLTMGQWQSIPRPPFSGTTYAPGAPEAQWYACPTPPIQPDACSAGPASRTNYTNMIHTKCQTYAYPYDDAFGLASCPAATNLRYDVTFYCPQ
jgi:hypothetical protein